MTPTMVLRSPGNDARQAVTSLLLAAAVLLGGLLPALAPPVRLPAPAPAVSPEQAVRAVDGAVTDSADALERMGRFIAYYRPEGLRFQPRFGGPTWDWRLEAVRAGGADVPGVALGALAPAQGNDRVDYDRGAIVERYVQRGARGVEQQFVLPSQLSLGGADLEIIGAVDATGAFAATEGGWEWRTDKGAVTLGDVTVFDAAGATLPAEMEVTADSTRIVVDGAALERAAYPVTVDPLVGADDSALTNASGLGASFDAFEPSAAYNPQTNQYLVVFVADGIARPDGEFEIYGQFVDATTGAPIDSNPATPAVDPFRISQVGNYVKEGGQSIADFGSEPANADFFDAFSPDVVYAPPGSFSNEAGTTNWPGGFAVVWVADNTNPRASAATSGGGHNSNGSFEVYIQLLSNDGDLLLQWRNEQTDAFMGPKDDRLSGILAAKEPIFPRTPDWDAFAPSVAYNPDDGEFLVCWTDDRGSPVDVSTIDGGEFEIRCVRFGLERPTSGDTRQFVGTIPPVLTVSTTGQNQTQNPTNYTAWDAYTPDVAYRPAPEGGPTQANELPGQWFVVWAGDHATRFVEEPPGSGTFVEEEKFDIYGQMLSRDGRAAHTVTGTLNDPYRDDHRLTTVGQSTSCGAGCDAFYPAVAYNPDRDQFLVSLTADNVNGADEVFVVLRSIFGSGVSGGSLQQVSEMGEGLGNANALKGLESDVAYDAGLEQWLVAWRGDDGPTNDDPFRIYGQRIDAKTPGGSSPNAFVLIDDNPSASRTDLSFGTTRSATPAFYNNGDQLDETIIQFFPPAGPGNDSDDLATRNMLAPKIAATGGGNYMVVWAGDKTAGQMEVRARLASFNTAPSVAAVADIDGVEATGPEGAVVTFATPSATDPEEGAVTASCTPASGSSFPLGPTTVICSASDSIGAIGSSSFTVTVVDTTAPAITVPANISAEATGPGGAAVSFTAPSASDLVDGAIAPACVSAPTAGLSSGSTFPLGATTITCDASDAAGNAAAERSFTVTVVDTTGPAITVPGNIALPATSEAGAVVTFATPSASDLVAGPITPSCVSSPTPGLLSGDTFPAGTTTIECTASDGANESTRSFTVTVAPFGARANLSLSRTVSPSPARPGQDLTVTFTIGNAGPQAATGVALTVPVPAGTSFKSGPASCAPAGGQLTCAVGTVASGASVSVALVFTVSADASGSLSIGGTVGGAEIDPVTANNSAGGNVPVEDPGPAPDEFRIYMPLLRR